MLKNVITSKNADYITFLQCDCGNELIGIYYYHEVPNCEEIILLDYFGYLKNELDNRYRYFSFTKTIFEMFLNDLIRSQELEDFYGEYYNKGSYLVLEKDKLDFYTLYNYSSKQNLTKKKSIWNIAIKNPQLSEFIDELKNMYKIIEEWNSPEKLKEVYEK